MDDMVMIVAYVRRARRVQVGQALRLLEQGGWTESEVLGHGNAAAGHAVEHVRFEVLLRAGQAKSCSQAIAAAAATGSEGDGLVLSMPVLSVSPIVGFAGDVVPR
jgi:nitrogen regulatory protein PII